MTTRRKSVKPAGAGARAGSSLSHPFNPEAALKLFNGAHRRRGNSLANGAELADLLNRAWARRHAVHTHPLRDLSPAPLAQQLANIERAARALNDALGLPQKLDPHPSEMPVAMLSVLPRHVTLVDTELLIHAHRSSPGFNDWGIKQALDTTAHAVRALARWARAARLRAEARRRAATRRPRIREEDTRFIEDLVTAFIKVGGRRSTAEDSPCARFVLASLSHVGVGGLTGATLAKRWKRAKAAA